MTPHSGGLLGLADNDLIVQSGDCNNAAPDDNTLAQVTAWIAAGYDNGPFKGFNSAPNEAPYPASIISMVASSAISTKA